MAQVRVNPPRRGWSLTLRPRDWDRLSRHLFGHDEDEHGAVILAEQVAGPRGPRLLGRELILAKEGTDYVPGTHGYRALTADFVRDCALRARRRGLAYVPIHNHFSGTRAGFSSTDLASHHRGYPALLGLTSQPVMGLVITPEAAAGDIWLTDGSQHELAELVVPGRNLLRLRDRLAADTTAFVEAPEIYNRQARLFGDAGQQLLGGMQVAVVGLGGAGSLLVEFLARLGVGALVLIDSDVVTIDNLPRIVAGTRTDIGLPKTELSARNARRANPDIELDIHQAEVQGDATTSTLELCDWIFLAADTHAARHWVNKVVETRLIPGTQVGVKIPVDADGRVGLIHTVSRRLMPGAGCLWCNGLIDATELAIDMAPVAQRQVVRYVDRVPAPSVITLNSIAVAEAANDFLFSVTNLHHSDSTATSGSVTGSTAEAEYTTTFPRHRRIHRITPRRDPNCQWCGDFSTE